MKSIRTNLAKHMIFFVIALISLLPITANSTAIQAREPGTNDTVTYEYPCKGLERLYSPDECYYLKKIVEKLPEYNMVLTHIEKCRVIDDEAISVQFDDGSLTLYTSIKPLTEEQREEYYRRYGYPEGYKVMEASQKDNERNKINNNVAVVKELEEELKDEFDNQVKEVAESIPNNIIKDIKETDWYYKSVNYLFNKGVSLTYQDDTFRPQINITFQEAVNMLASALKTESENFYEEKFDNYDRPINRGEMVHLLAKALEYNGEKSYLNSINEYKTQICDYDEISEKIQPYVLKVYSKGIITGNSDWKFKESNPITRAEAAVMTERLINREARKKPFIMPVFKAYDDKSIQKRGYWFAIDVDYSMFGRDTLEYFIKNWQVSSPVCTSHPNLNEFYLKSSMNGEYCLTNIRDTDYRDFRCVGEESVKKWASGKGRIPIVPSEVGTRYTKPVSLKPGNTIRFVVSLRKLKEGVDYDTIKSLIDSRHKVSDDEQYFDYYTQIITYTIKDNR